MPALKLDVLPANVKVGPSDDDQHDRARVIVNNQGRAAAFVARQGKIVKVAELEGAEVQSTGRREYSITSGDQTWTCQKSGSCGCNSPLRRMNIKEVMK